MFRGPSDDPGLWKWKVLKCAEDKGMHCLQREAWTAWSKQQDAEGTVGNSCIMHIVCY